jgi:hypothetical protein
MSAAASLGFGRLAGVGRWAGALASWAVAPGNWRHVAGALARSRARQRARGWGGLRWWHAALAVYCALLWRSTRKSRRDPGAEAVWRRAGTPWGWLLVSHVVLLRYLLGKASLGVLLVRTLTAKAREAPRYAAEYVVRQRLLLQEGLQSRVEEFLDRQMDQVGEKTKELLKDPYMPVRIQGTIEDFVDVLLPDLKLALFTKTNEYIGSYRTAAEAQAQAQMQAQAKARARILLGATRRRSSSTSARPRGKSQGGEDDAGANASAGAAVDEEEQVLDSVLAALEEGEDEDEDEDSSLGDSDWDSGDDDTSDSDESAQRGEQAGEVHFRGLVATPRRGLLKGAGEAAAGAGGAGGLRLHSVVFREQARPHEWSAALPLRARAHRLAAALASARRRAATVVTDRWRRSRAWILYTLSPFDRSFWRCIRNPYYVLLNVIGLIPGVGMLFWLLVFVLLDKRDEYQLSQFIVGFQTAKFFSQGCFNLCRGALLYYICATRDLPRCETRGPQVRDYADALFFAVQMLIVWLSFFLLPYSEPCYAVNDPAHAYLLDEARNDRGQAALRAKVRLGRGGRLTNLFWWDTFAVLLVFSLAALAYLGTGQRDWQFRATCYWLSVLFGLCSFPFVPFKLPVMGNLLTPTKATGYTRTGDTVLRVLAPPPQQLLSSQTLALAHQRTVRRPSALLVLPPSLQTLPQQTLPQQTKHHHQLNQTQEQQQPQRRLAATTKSKSPASPSTLLASKRLSALQIDTSRPVKRASGDSEASTTVEDARGSGVEAEVHNSTEGGAEADAFAAAAALAAVAAEADGREPRSPYSQLAVQQVDRRTFAGFFLRDSFESELLQAQLDDMAAREAASPQTRSPAPASAATPRSGRPLNVEAASSAVAQQTGAASSLASKQILRRLSWQRP